MQDKHGYHGKQSEYRLYHVVAYGSKANNSQNEKKYTEKSSSEKKIETVDWIYGLDGFWFLIDRSRSSGLEKNLRTIFI